MDAGEEYINCLLADFTSIKGEIARRSTLQRFVLVGFATVLILIFQQSTSYTLTSDWIMGLWVSSALFLQFYMREHIEIRRLGTIIKREIARDAGLILARSPMSLFHSETLLVDQEEQDCRTLWYDAKFRCWTQPYDAQFNWAVFFLLPFLMTLGSIASVPFSSLSMPSAKEWIAFSVFFGAVLRCFLLLKRHAYPIWYRARHQ